MKFYFLFFQDCTEIGDGWLKLYLFAANHLYLATKEYFFTIPMYCEAGDKEIVTINLFWSKNSPPRNCECLLHGYPS